MRITITVLLLLGVAFVIGADAASDEALAEANNPLAGITSVNFHNYYSPVLSGTADMANMFNIRVAQPFFKGRLLIRATLPVATSFSTSAGGSSTGLGNTNIFATYSFVNTPRAVVGVGPFMLFPATGGKGSSGWQLGAAYVMFFIPSPAFQWGGLITWQADLSGLDRGNLLAVQPFAFIQMGNGFYLRSSGIATFDFTTGNINIPFGLGIGKVLSAPSGTVFNAILEPQFSIYNVGDGNPVVQLFIGLNAQFPN